VVRLTDGVVGGVGTYGPGRRVAGVRIRADHVEVHVVVAVSTASLAAIAAGIRQAVSAVEPTRRIDVFIDDIDPEIIDVDAVDLVADRD